MPGIDYVERFQSQPLDASARQESVAWILKVIIIKTPRFRSDCIPCVSSLTNLRARRDRITSFVIVFIQLANLNVKTAFVLLVPRFPIWMPGGAFYGIVSGCAYCIIDIEKQSRILESRCMMRRTVACWHVRLWSLEECPIIGDSSEIRRRSVTLFLACVACPSELN